MAKNASAGRKSGSRVSFVTGGLYSLDSRARNAGTFCRTLPYMMLPFGMEHPATYTDYPKAD
jgi:hypothetical protein